MMTKEHSDFLKALRASGVTNMFGAVPYIQEEFGVSHQEARQILFEWMDSIK